VTQDRELIKQADDRRDSFAADLAMFRAEPPDRKIPISKLMVTS